MKNFYSLLMALMVVVGAYGQCTTGGSLGTLPTTVGFQTIPVSAGPAAYYTFTGSAGQTVVFSYCQAGGSQAGDSYLTVTDNTPTALTQNDDFCGLGSEISYTIPATGTYRVYLSGCCPCSDSPSGVLAFNIPGLPNIDNCANAQSLTCGSIVTGSTVASTLDGPGTSCTGGSVAADNWYTFTGTGANVTASLCGGTDYDSKLDIYTGTCGALTSVVCNDDACGLQSAITWPTVLGTTYYIRVHGFGGDVGNYTLTLNNGSVNDICATAIPVTAGSVTGNTVCTGNDNVLTCGTTNGTGGGLWYTYTSPTCVNVNANTCTGTDFDTKIRVFTGSCAALTCVGGNDDACGAGSSVNWSADAGVTYYILVHGFSGSQGNFTLTIAESAYTDIVAPVANTATLADVTAECEVTSLTAPTATDNCAGNITGTTATTLPITTQGTTVITWTYNDGNGNISTQTQNVVIDDVTAPVADVATLADVTSECSVASITAPTATDACVGAVTGTTATVFPITTQGTTVVTWTYDDGNGNTSTQTQNVIIDDVTAPVADAPGPNTFEIRIIGNDTWLDESTWTLADASMTTVAFGGPYFGGLQGFGVLVASVNVPVLNGPYTFAGETQGTFGDNIMTYEVYCNGNLVANGTIAANSTGLSSGIVACDNGGLLPAVTAVCEVTSLTAPTATDNCAGSVTGTTATVFPITTQGTTVVTWTYDDGNGNTSTQTQNVIIDDVTAPVADAATLADVTAECEVTSLTAPTATDNCAGMVTVSNDAVLPITTQGTTVVTWTYDDGNGNTSTQTQNVVIEDVTSPVADVATLADVTAECEVTSLTDPTATDNCGGMVMVSNDAVLPITAQGTTVVTWTYEDMNGNSSTQTQNVVITDVTGPVADVATLADVTAECEVTSLTDPTATDNCGGTVTVSNDAVLPITTQGTTVVTWTYEDENGNTSTQTQNVVIEDVTAPVADVATLADVTATCEVTSLTDPTATDNCGGMVTVSNDAVFPITADATVTWTYEDENGNTSTQTQEVLISGVDATVTVSGATITANNTNTGVTYQWVDCDNANAPISGATSVSFTATADGNYAVEVTEDGCTETSACTLIDLSNVTVLTADLIKVYPNPATSVLNIETTTEGTVGFYDVSGKLIFTQNVIAGTNEMNVDQLATGTYTLRLTTANGIQTIRLVITK
jgi:hypothetical protein